MTTETPNYLTDEQARVINDFQRVVREIMPEGATYCALNFGDDYATFSLHSNYHIFNGGYAHDGDSLLPPVNNAIHQFRAAIKSPAEQAKLDYEAAMKAVEKAVAKLAEFEEAENAQV